MDELWDEADELVVQGQNPEKRVAIQETALRQLRDAMQYKGPRVLVWLDTCARLRVQEAGPIVLQIMQEGHRWDQVVLVAFDAARSVARDPECRYAVADILFRDCEKLLQRYASHAGRALMSAIMLDDRRGLERAIPLLLHWPDDALDPPLRAVGGRLINFTYTQRADAPGIDELRLFLETLVRSPARLRFARAVALEVLVLLTPEDPSEMIKLLCALHQSEDVVLLAGATSAAALLCRERPEVVERLSLTPEGQSLLQASAVAPKQTFYFYTDTPVSS